MTRQTRRRLAQQMLRLRMRLELQLDRQLRTEFWRVVSEAAEAFPRWTRVMPAHRLRVQAILAASGQRAALASAHLTRAQWGKAAHGVEETKLDTAEEMDDRVVRVARLRARERAVDVERTTRARIFNAVEEGLRAHDTPAEIARSIRDEVGAMTHSRARTISRTETAVATNTAQQVEMEETAKDLGLDMVKVWTSSDDERTRETHKEADGQSVPLDEPFDVGGVPLMHPSDPDGAPEEVINCRCVVVHDVRR